MIDDAKADLFYQKLQKAEKRIKVLERALKNTIMKIWVVITGHDLQEIIDWAIAQAEAQLDKEATEK